MLLSTICRLRPAISRLSTRMVSFDSSVAASMLDTPAKRAMYSFIGEPVQGSNIDWWCSTLMVHAEKGRWVECTEMFRYMQSAGITPTIPAWKCLFLSHAQAGHVNAFPDLLDSAHTDLAASLQLTDQAMEQLMTLALSGIFNAVRFHALNNNKRVLNIQTHNSSRPFHNLTDYPIITKNINIPKMTPGELSKYPLPFVSNLNLTSFDIMTYLLDCAQGCLLSNMNSTMLWEVFLNILVRTSQYNRLSELLVEKRNFEILIPSHVLDGYDNLKIQNMILQAKSNCNDLNVVSQAFDEYSNLKILPASQITHFQFLRSFIQSFARLDEYEKAEEIMNRELNGKLKVVADLNTYTEILNSIARTHNVAEVQRFGNRMKHDKLFYGIKKWEMHKMVKKNL